eukprot:5814695-Prymnesium_polylepis.1
MRGSTGLRRVRHMVHAERARFSRYDAVTRPLHWDALSPPHALRARALTAPALAPSLCVPPPRRPHSLTHSPT